ncbi:hypothetical protein EV175_004082 [Coemansia sp. RSA 1933]|nr:hypothetical protein EV175_004082 [Coemansia sp. RSA 1933]
MNTAISNVIGRVAAHKAATCGSRRVAIATLSSSVSGTPVRSTVAGIAPILSSHNAKVIKDSYIVELKDSAAASSQQVLQSHLAWLTSYIKQANARAPAFHDANRITNIYKHVMLGYGGRFEPAILELIRRSKDVESIERNAQMYLAETQHID